MFQSEQVVFKKLNRLPITKRVAIAATPEGKSILGSLTPSQLADLFPRYYQQRLPDTGGFDRATTETAREQQAAASESLLDRLTRAEKGLEEYASEKYLYVKRKLGFGAKPPAGLTPEQEAAWNKIVSGAVDINSSEGKLFGRLTDSQLASLGISRGKDNTGRDVFQYAAPQVGREEAISRLKSGGDIEKVMASIRKIESGSFEGNYGAHAKTSSASGAYQFIKSTWQDATKRAGIGTEYSEAYMAPKSVQDAVAKAEMERIIKQHGIEKLTNVWFVGNAEGRMSQEQMDANPGVTAETYRSKFFGHMSTLGESKQYAGEKPDGANGAYSDDQINKMMTQLADEKNVARKQQLANLLTDAGVDTATINSVSTVTTSGVTGEHFGEGKQCVALTKHFAPNVGPAANWKFHDDISGIVPGAAIATTRYGNGDAGRMASQMPDGHSHYHTGIALTKPDAKGDVLIFDQALGHGSKITKINIHDYNGEKWRPIVGGEPTARSMQAVDMALARANESEKAAITGSMRGETPKAASTPEIKPVVDAAPPPAKPVDQEGRPLPPQEAQRPTPGQPKPTETATVSPPKEQPKTPNRYRVDQAGLIAAIKNTDEFKNTFGSSLATDSMILNGFASDPRVTAAGVTYDPATGIMKFKDPNDPRVKEALAGLDSKKFMTPIEEKKKEEAKSKTEAPPPKPTPVPEKKAEAPAPQRSAQAPVTQPQQPQQVAQAQPVATAPAVPGASDGGSFGVQGDVNFFPMDKRDNIAAVDTKTQQPLFTARSGERIDVTPSQKVQGNMAAPDNGIRNEFESLRREIGNFGSSNEPSKPVMAQVQRGQQNPDIVPDFTGTLNDQNKNKPYHNPAFERAMNRTRLQETGDTLNNHFSGGNTNY